MPDTLLPPVIAPEHHYRITKCVLQHWNATKFSYTSHSRPDHGFLLPIKGKISFVTSGVQLVANPGDLIYLPKGIHYEACIPPEFGKTEDYLINFDIHSSLPVPLPQQPQKLLHVENHELVDLFERIVQGKSARSSSVFQTTGLFYLLLAKISEEYNDFSLNMKSCLVQAEEFLTNRTDLSIREIATLCGISESSLRSHFHRAYGISPQQYRVNIKIEKAKYLLETTDLSVYEIADQLDFYDEAYFCKMFRKITGCSPKKYTSMQTI